jgi:hypothetical protein
MRDLANSLAVRRAISPAAAVSDNTAFVSQIIDLSGFGGMAFVINAGSLADADATFTTLVEHGDAANLSDAAAVPDAQLTGTEAAASFTFADDNAVKKIGYAGSKRYVRLTITPVNNAGSAFISAIALLGHSRFWPSV